MWSSAFRYAKDESMPVKLTGFPVLWYVQYAMSDSVELERENGMKLSLPYGAVKSISRGEYFELRVRISLYDDTF